MHNSDRETDELTELSLRMLHFAIASRGKTAQIPSCSFTVNGEAVV